MAAGVGKTYRMLLEGGQAQEEGRDVVIGYLEPHDRPETSALAEGLEVVPRLRAQHGTLELEEMDLDARPRACAASSRSSTSSRTRTRRGMRNEKRWQDIEEVLDAGIDVISTVNVQHLESLNDAIFELTERPRSRDLPRPGPRRGGRGRARRPVARKSSGSACGPARSTPRSKPRSRSTNFFRADKLGALRELALREVAEDVEARRAARTARAAQSDRRSRSACSRSSSRSRSRSASCGARGAPRSGSARRWTRSGYARRDGRPRRRKRRSSRRCGGSRASSASTSSRRRATTSSPPTRRVAAERGSTYIFVGTPDESRRREIFGGSLLSRMVRELPGHRHPRHREPGRQGSAEPSNDRRRHRARSARSRPRRGSRRPQRVRLRRPRPGTRRVLVPFTGGTLDPTVLDAAIRLAHAEKRDTRSRLPPARPAPLRGRLAAARRGRRGAAAARGRRARCPPGRSSRRRADREGAQHHSRPPAPMGRRAVRPDRGPSAH